MQTDTCPDCGVNPDEFHKEGCDVERCRQCGRQFLFCSHEEKYENRLKWTGNWPGTEECEEFGWYCKFLPDEGYVQCTKEEKGSMPDLNRLQCQAIWSKGLGRFIKKK